MNFSKQEYAGRHEAARRLMQEQQIDALFITGDDHFLYFTGSETVMHWRAFARPAYLLIPQEGEPVGLVHQGYIEATQTNSCISDIRKYEGMAEPPLKELDALFREKGLSKARVGAELGYEQRMGMPFNWFNNMVAQLDKVRFVDASDILWRLRFIKSEEEVNVMRRACEITSKARQSCFDNVKVGMTELEVARVFSKSTIEYGADKPSFVYVCSGPFKGWYPTENKVKKGDLLWIDGGADIGGWTCDFDRFAVIGKPSEDQIKAHSFIVEAAKDLSKLFVPGARVADLWRATADRLSKFGETPMAAERFGHGQGMLPCEPPSIAEWDPRTLQPGMVVCCEPGLVTNYGIFIWEDVFHITKNGHEVLNHETDELRSI